MKKTSITTIIPTYQRPQLLSKAIASVLNQSFSDLLVCVYDNDSQDHTKEIVSEWIKKDSRVRYFCHKKNMGGNANFQYGLHRVETPFFSFLSDDDVLLPWFYQEALEQLHKYPKAAFFGGATVFIDNKGTALSLKGTGTAEGFHSPATVLPNNNWTPFLFRTKEAQQLDLHTEVFHMDGDFLIRMYCQYPFVISHKPCALFRRHPLGASSQCSSQELHDHYQKMSRVLHSNPHIPMAMKTSIEIFLKNSLTNQLVATSLKALYEKNFSKALSESLLLQKLVHEKRKSVWVRLLTTLCQKSSLTHHMFCYLIDLLRFLKKRKKKIPLSDECLSVIEKYR